MKIWVNGPGQAMTSFTIKVPGRAAAVRAMYPSTRDYGRDCLSDETPDFSDAYLEGIAVQRKITEHFIYVKNIVNNLCIIWLTLNGKIM